MKKYNPLFENADPYIEKLLGKVKKTIDEALITRKRLLFPISSYLSSVWKNYSPFYMQSHRLEQVGFDLEYIGFDLKDERYNWIKPEAPKFLRQKWDAMHENAKEVEKYFRETLIKYYNNKGYQVSLHNETRSFLEPEFRKYALRQGFNLCIQIS